MNILKLAPLIVGVMLLASCTDDEARHLLANPSVSMVGTFDGCEVKFVNRGYSSTSFYIARCGDTDTATRNWTEGQGRSTVDRRSTVITDHVRRSIEISNALAVIS